ncbi:hypothetical protein I6H96_02340 [Brucella anthropi]|nr:hypothetical protein [Brucella anthropi]QQC25722.1 hypothetical protein I6H96_02340 [Brucella anthropi]SUA65633.1 Uncharacterised protein [Brucella anthropi]
MWTAIVKWITGDLVGQLTKAYEAKLKASNETERIIADVAIKDLERQIADRQAAKEIRLSTSGFWEMRLITFLIAGSFTLHLILVSFDTCFSLGWKIPRYPAPFDEWQGTILLSFFGVQVVGQGISAIAGAIRGRK